MKPDRILQLSIVALLAVFVFILYSSLHEIEVHAGDKAPDFSVTASNGKTITPKNFGGKLLILNFWATWCPPCVEETPSLIELSRIMGPKGLVVLAVSVDSKKDAYDKFLKRFNVPFPTFFDPEQKINVSYGSVAYPETYLIDPSGKVIEKIIGPENWTGPQMLDHINGLLN